MREAIQQAHERVRPHVDRTDCIRSPALSEAAGAEVFLKLENRQRSGSFKLRGVVNKLCSLSPEDASKRMIAASTGNHGAAFAHAITEFDLDGLLFLPRNTAAIKLRSIDSAGIPYELVGDDCVETEAYASAFAAENGCVWVSPYNDPWIVAGQGTIAVELLDQVGGMDCVLVPVGGGGLISGIASYLNAKAPGVEVIGCQPRASAAMYESVKAGEIVTIESRPTLSDATAGGIEPGSITFDLCRRLVDGYELLDEEELARAIRFVHQNEGMVIEGGAALPVAAVLRRPAGVQGKKVVLVITGSKLDEDVLRRILS